MCTPVAAGDASKASLRNFISSGASSGEYWLREHAPDAHISPRPSVCAGHEGQK